MRKDGGPCDGCGPNGDTPVPIAEQSTMCFLLASDAPATSAAAWFSTPTSSTSLVFVSLPKPPTAVVMATVSMSSKAAVSEDGTVTSP